MRGLGTPHRFPNGARRARQMRKDRRLLSQSGNPPSPPLSTLGRGEPNLACGRSEQVHTGLVTLISRDSVMVPAAHRSKNVVKNTGFQGLKDPPFDLRGYSRRLQRSLMSIKVVNAKDASAPAERNVLCGGGAWPTPIPSEQPHTAESPKREPPRTPRAPKID